MLAIIFNNFRIRKLMTAATALIIVISVTMVVTLVSISEGLRIQVDTAFEQFDKIVVGSSKLGGKMTYSDVEQIEGIQGVKVVNPAVYVYIQRLNGTPVYGTSITETTVVPSVLGIDPDRESQSPSDLYFKNLATGRALTSSDTNSALVGQTVADKFNLHYRSALDLDGTKFEVVGIYKTGLSYTESSIVIPIVTAQEMAELDKTKVDGVWVDVENKRDTDKVAKKIAYEVTGVTVKTPEQLKSQFGEFESTLRKILWVIAVVPAIVGAIAVLVVMMMTVMQRRREIGVLRAVGWTRREIMLTFLTESIIIALIGGMLGVGVGFIGKWIMGILLPVFPAEITVALVAEAMFVALLVGAVGGLYPAWRASSVDPIEALRYV